MKRLVVVLLFILPFFLKAQSGCSDPEASNYYCNTDSGNPQINPTTGCVFSGIGGDGAPVFSLPAGFVYY